MAFLTEYPLFCPLFLSLSLPRTLHHIPQRIASPCFDWQSSQPKKVNINLSIMLLLLSNGCTISTGSVIQFY